MKYRLGLDVGANSLGWSVLELDADGKQPVKIIDAGARIFTDGRDNKSKATLAADRRDARSARRRRDRYKQRRKFLLHELTKAGLFPQDETARQTLQLLNPIELRARLLAENTTDILADIQRRTHKSADKDIDGTPTEDAKAAAHPDMKPAYLVGRALFHLNQRRGFQSNRKDRSEETTSGKVSGSVRMLLQEMGLIAPQMPQSEYKELSQEAKKQARQEEAQARETALEKLGKQTDLTFGSFLYERHKRKKPTRARPGAGDDGKLYDVYPSRQLYEDEFNKIWEAQAKHFSQEMADKEQFRKIIFTQRPLKPQKRGKCAYMPDHERTFRAMPSFQRYRIYQEVNNLEWSTAEGRHHLRHYPEARDAIIRLLEKPEPKKTGEIAHNKQIVWGKMRKILKDKGIAEGAIEFNFETPKRKGLDGNLTSNIMQHEDYVGPNWHKWDLEKQDRFIDIILNGTPAQKQRDKGDDETGKVKKAITDGAQDDKEIAAYLMGNDFKLSEYAAKNCVNARLVDGTASLSQEAAKRMLEKMRAGETKSVDNEGEVRTALPLQSDAARLCAAEDPKFIDPFRSKGDDGKGTKEDTLPYYGKWFRDGRHIIPGDRLQEDEGNERKFFGGVTNPTVHIALNQIRQVVNELINRFGHPESIAVELGRELPEGAEKRNEIEREQKANQEKNKLLDKILIKYEQQTNRTNRLRLALWEDLGEKPTDRRCPFSGKIIAIADLFNGKAEIEHLIPFSISLDDSRANKVLCTRQANRDKGQRTPFEAFGNNPDGYLWGEIFQRVQNLPKSKQWRFQENALEIWQRDYADFTERHLNDTRYIGRLTREYLEAVCHIDKIDVLTGRLTALLRGHWGLNSVLKELAGKTDHPKDDNQPEESRTEKPAKKNRDDHRHHAIDAIVIGMTNRSMLQKVATESNKSEELEVGRLFPKNEAGKSVIDPWDGFRDAVKEAAKAITVSHKTKRSLQGQLHKKFTYGFASKQVREELAEKDSVSVIKTEVVLRRSTNDFSSEKHVSEIRDKNLRTAFLAAFKTDGKDGFLKLAADKKIRHLRVELERTVQPIKDGDGNAYKAFWLRGNWATEIFAVPKKGKSKNGEYVWEGKTISRFEANSPGFNVNDVRSRLPHPAARFIMRLHNEDFVEIQDEENPDKKRIMRVQKMSGGGVYIVEHQEANVADRLKELVDNNIAISATAGRLQKLKARKVHISPTGQINYETCHEKRQAKNSKRRAKKTL